MTRSSQTRVVLQVILTIAGVVAGAWALQKLASVVLVLIIAGLFAYVIAPLVELAERPVCVAGRSRRLSRGAAVVAVYVLLAASVSIGAAILTPSATRQAGEMIASVPMYTQSILTWERGWARYYVHLRIPPELRQFVDQSVTKADESAVESARGALLPLAGALSHLPWLLLIPILAFFLLKDGSEIRKTIVTALPHRIRLRCHRLFEDVNATLAAYIRAQLLACVLVGSMCGIGFAALGIPYPVLLGVLAGILEFIPLIGPLLLATVATIVGALHSPMLPLRAIGFLAALRLIEDYVVYPRLIRRGVELHPLAVIVAVLAGAELHGVVGVFLAVPAVAIGSVVARHSLEWRRGDSQSPVLFGTVEPPPRPYSRDRSDGHDAHTRSGPSRGVREDAGAS